MAARPLSSPDVMGAGPEVDPSVKMESALRYPSEAKPRREPYRPSTSGLLPTPAAAANATHMDVASPVIGMPRVYMPAVSSPVRSSIPDSLIQQVRNTPHNLSGSRSTTAVAGAGNSVRRPVYNHSSILNINSANEAPLSAPACSMTLKEVFSPFSVSASSSQGTSSSHQLMCAAVAHVMRRERTRQLLSRVLLRWSLFVKPRRLARTKSSGNDKPAHGRSASQSSGLMAPATSPLPPWKPIAGGGVHSGSSAEDHDADNVEENHHHHRSADDDSLIDPEENNDNGREGKGEASVQEASSDLPDSNNNNNTAVTTRAGNREASAAAVGQLPPNDTQAVSAGKPSVAVQRSAQASQRTTPIPTPQSVPASTRKATPNGESCGNDSRNDSSTGSPVGQHPSTTPRQHGAETRRKSVVSQYLAGKPLGNLSPQQSSTNLFTNAGSALTNGVVEVHTLALPGAVLSGQHSRSQSGTGGLNASFPCRRSEGLWGFASTTINTAAASHSAGGGAAAAATAAGTLSDAEEHSNSSLYFTPRSRQSNTASGLGAFIDEDACLSSSRSGISAAAVNSAGGGVSNGARSAAEGGQRRGTSPGVPSLPHLLIQEAEDRSSVQATEIRRRARMQLEYSARMDQLMMAALRHRSSERGLHPSLRPSAAPSPLPISRSFSSHNLRDTSGDETENDFVNHSCGTSECNMQSYGGQSRRSAPRSPGQASTHSSGSTGVVGFTGAPLNIFQSSSQQGQQQQQQLQASRTRPRLPEMKHGSDNDAAGAAAGTVQRGKREKAGKKEVDEDDGGCAEAESLSDTSRNDEESEEGASGARGREHRQHPHYHHNQHHHDPLGHDTPLGKGRYSAESEKTYNDDDDGADTQTAQSEGTVHGLATTRQWVSQQIPESAVVAAAAAAAAAAAREEEGGSAVSESISRELSSASMSLSLLHPHES